MMKFNKGDLVDDVLLILCVALFFANLAFAIVGESIINAVVSAFLFFVITKRLL